MARTITHTGGGPFLGNPITFSLPALSLAGNKDIDLTKVAFHRVVMLVTVGGVTYELSKSVSHELPAGVGVEVEFDVASAFQSAADSRQYGPVTSGTVGYDIYRATINAHDVWVYDGKLVDRQGVATPVVYDAISGAYSDYERLLPRQTATPTRKPAAGEMVLAGDPYVYGQLYDGMDLQPRSMAVSVAADKAGKHISIGGRSIFVLSPSVIGPSESQIFQFVSSRGLVESVRAFHLPKEQIEGETQTIVRAFPETFQHFSRRVERKFGQSDVISCSSGFVTYEWARWWQEEFCQSSHHWMLSPDGVWVPCCIKADGKSALMDRSKSELLSVQFTATPDLSGSMW